MACFSSCVALADAQRSKGSFRSDFATLPFALLYELLRAPCMLGSIKIGAAISRSVSGVILPVRWSQSPKIGFVGSVFAVALIECLVKL
jgi:hypothetical protein